MSLFLIMLFGFVTHDTFIAAVGPPLPPQGNLPIMLAGRSGGQLLSRVMFRTDTVKPWHVLTLDRIEDNPQNAQINAYDIVGWNWDENTATWQNKQGNIQNPVACVMTFIGDVNLDRRVDAADWQIVNNNWYMQTNQWTDGDLNGDGIVNAKDLNLVGSNYRKDVANQPSEILFIPKSGNNIAIEPINTAQVRFKSKEAP